MIFFHYPIFNNFNVPWKCMIVLMKIATKSKKSYNILKIVFFKHIFCKKFPYLGIYMWFQGKKTSWEIGVSNISDNRDNHFVEPWLSLPFLSAYPGQCYLSILVIVIMVFLPVLSCYPSRSYPAIRASFILLFWQVLFWPVLSYYHGHNCWY